MSGGKMLRLGLATIIILALSGCVSKSTFENMAGQAKKLDADLTDLQGRHQALLAQQNELQANHAVLRGEKTRLEEEKSTLLAQIEALAASNRELEEILAAREDNLTRKIAEQRQELGDQQTKYDGRLAEQSRQLAAGAAKITDLEESIRQKDARIDNHEKKIAQLEKRLAEQERQLAVAKTTNDLLNEDLQLLRQEKESEVREMSNTYQALLGQMKNEIDNGQITISELKGKLTVNMIDAILFDSGKAEVKPEGLLVLQRVIDILKEVSGKTIRIEGHTDNVPIIGGLAQKYPTNWELSAARAVNVARFLQARGIDPLTLNAVAYGEYKPVAENTNETGRARNRRIEIILVNRE